MPSIVDGNVSSVTQNTQFDRQPMESQWYEITYKTIIYPIKKQTSNNNSIRHKNDILIEMR